MDEGEKENEKHILCRETKRISVRGKELIEKASKGGRGYSNRQRISENTHRRWNRGKMRRRGTEGNLGGVRRSQSIMTAGRHSSWQLG